jgi:hypothetical protein
LLRPLAQAQCWGGELGIPSRRTLVEIMTPGKDIEVHVGVVPAWCYRGACFELVRAISGGDLHECLLQTVLQ